MRPISILEDYQHFLKKHRIGIAADNVEEITQSLYSSNSFQIMEIIDKFPELKSYASYLCSGKPRLTEEDYQTLSDEELVRWQDLLSIPYGFFNPVKVELIIMQLIIDIANRTNFHKPTILDVGCGVGHRLSFLASRKILKSGYLGVDLSDMNLKRAREIAETEKARVVFTKNQAHSLPFSHESISWVWMIDIIQWIKDWESALNEVGRVLQNNGLLLLIYNQTPLRSEVKPDEAIQVLLKSNIKAGRIDSRGLDSVFILGMKSK